MKNDIIKVTEKIITVDDLTSIFRLVNEKLVFYQELSKKQLSNNSSRWEFKDEGSYLKFEINWQDDTNTEYTNYEDFNKDFGAKLKDIVNIYVCFNLSYSIRTEAVRRDAVMQRIDLKIFEDKIVVESQLLEDDPRISEVLDLIVSLVEKAPERYDAIIKDKTKINFIISLGMGMVPALVINSLMLFNSAINELYISTYILYPLVTLILAFIIGYILSYFSIAKDYQNILSHNLAEDNLESVSEILIGKNTGNQASRAKIRKYYLINKALLFCDIAVLIVLSILIIVLGVI